MSLSISPSTLAPTPPGQPKAVGQVGAVLADEGLAVSGESIRLDVPIESIRLDVPIESIRLDVSGENIRLDASGERIKLDVPRESIRLDVCGEAPLADPKVVGVIILVVEAVVSLHLHI